MEDLFGNIIKEDKKNISFVKELQAVFKGRILSATEIKLLPKSIRNIK